MAPPAPQCWGRGALRRVLPALRHARSPQDWGAGGARLATMQAGGGIVADSDPTLEHYECLNKLKAVERAIEIAENGLE